MKETPMVLCRGLPLLPALVLLPLPVVAQGLGGVPVADPYADLPRIVLETPPPRAAAPSRPPVEDTEPSREPTRIRSERARELEKAEEEYVRELGQAEREYGRELSGARDAVEVITKHQERLRKLDEKFAKKVQKIEEKFEKRRGRRGGTPRD